MICDWILSPMTTADLIFLHEHTIKFHNQSHPGLSGLLFLAAFS